MGKVVLKILQGSAVTQTMLGVPVSQPYVSQLQISYSVYMLKIMIICWQ